MKDKICECGEVMVKIKGCWGKWLPKEKIYFKCIACGKAYRPRVEELLDGREVQKMRK